MEGRSSGLPVPRSRAMGASEATMAKRRGHAESVGQDARRERPAQGHGQPRAARHAGSWCRLTTCTYVGNPEPGGPNTGWKPVLREAGTQAQVTNLCYWERTSRLREWLSLAASRQRRGFRCPTGCRSRHRSKPRRAADRRADARARHHKACSCCGSPAAQRAPPHPDR